MNVTTISDLRKNTKKYLDQIVQDDDILVLSRSGGKSVVIMPMRLFNTGMDATAYLNSSKANREHLEKGIADIKAGRTAAKTTEELRAA
jgi:antitoxin YefM